MLPQTGSCEHTLSKSRKTGEYLWFSLGDSAPGGTISAERATHEIVKECLVSVGKCFLLY